ncbi:Nmad2 family putative nucleotide modification protein [Polaromonas naphthalenivorans]|uniref:Nmad2 family putative nucleotide modification protein n=1 Tax=Polaromonas naphthalenivorans TaxID=216465 RepID=UPI0018DD0304
MALFSCKFSPHKSVNSPDGSRTCEYFRWYLMTHDSGFAPNPFHGTLTLATCKPGIRRTIDPAQ